MYLYCPQCGTVVRPGGPACKPGRPRQVGGPDPGRRAGRHGGVGAHAVGAGLRPVGQPAALRGHRRRRGPRQDTPRRPPPIDLINEYNRILAFIALLCEA